MEEIMIIFTWLMLITSFQAQQLNDVFLSAFLPQARSSTEELSAYFNGKIVPRLEQTPLLLAAIDNGRIIGFALFEKWEDEGYYLAEMAVLPEYQGQGIGKKLVFSIFEKDPTTSHVLLITETANRWARGFYETIGFKLSSFRHPDYPENFIGYEYWR
jgi:ribosomal protein S18 acetylase RimI-like enzyme